MTKYCRRKNLNQYKPRKSRRRRARKSQVYHVLKTEKKKLADEDWVITEAAMERLISMIPAQLATYQLLKVINQLLASIEVVQNHSSVSTTMVQNHSSVNTTMTTLINHLKPMETP